MEYTVHEAKTHFSRLLAALQQGHEVLITRGREREPIAQLVPYRPRGGVRLGLYADTELAHIDDAELLAPTYDEAEIAAIESKPVFPEEPAH